MIVKELIEMLQKRPQDEPLLCTLIFLDDVVRIANDHGVKISNWEAEEVIKNYLCDGFMDWADDDEDAMCYEIGRYLEYMNDDYERKHADEL